MKTLDYATLIVGCGILLGIGGCATAQPKLAPEVVQVPIAVPCLGPEVPEPTWQAAGNYPGDAAAIKALGADLVRAKDWAAQLAAQMKGCR